ncbi:NADH-quinone oxidoreductase subunit I [Heliorestis acidaminivorans]|uniref:NADH-quinone oxidoreductase subunit I n=1 Tax=Heliorestis acidaminivorans TaxID=553427 RepID=A0A6I0F0E2_9FIRM|nr:NADH-quinone oxidoreductase subunit I [Heliorestis acidaminivorans]KAB2954416.1 NADH-quinone oxidoreductase subunit I [Heliorestis acidaminivorans]
MLGKSLLTGMAVTLRELFRKNVTEEYPEVQPELGDRFRGGRLDLVVSKCIACGLCMNNCPNGSIKLKTVKDENNKRQLDSYIHNTGLCLFCNLCVEVCPTKCLVWSKEFAYAGYSRDALVFDCMALDRERIHREEQSQTTEEKG